MHAEYSQHSFHPSPRESVITQTLSPDLNHLKLWQKQRCVCRDTQILMTSRLLPLQQINKVYFCKGGNFVNSLPSASSPANLRGILSPSPSSCDPSSLLQV